MIEKNRLLNQLFYDVHTNTTQKPALPTKKSWAFLVLYHQPYTPYKSLLYNIPKLHPLYTTYTVLIYTRLLTTPSKFITIHNLHKKKISSSHHACVLQTQTYQCPHVSVGEARMGELWSLQGNRTPPSRYNTPTPHGWELPGNYPVFTMVMVIWNYVERIWRILVTLNFL